MNKPKITISLNFNEVKKNINKKIKRVKEKIQKYQYFNKNKIDKNTIKYTSVLVIMLVVAVVSTIANIKNYIKINEEKYYTYEVVNEDVQIEQSVKNKGEKNEVDNKQEGVEKNKYITAVSSIYQKMELLTTSSSNVSKSLWPVNGRIIKGYSVDKVIYYDTLDMWKTHPGVDISCEINQEVLSIFDGTVVAIYNDNIFGKTVVVEGDDYTAVYACLASDIVLHVGDKINEKQTIGRVGNANGELIEGPHLHFELLKENEYVNPEKLGIK